MANVFISYSRRDMEFTRKLHNRLDATKGDDNVWVDWEDIASAAPDFLEEIYAGIESADTFLVIVTPDSLKSEICHLEVAHAIQHGKRIVPIIHIGVVEDGKLHGDIIQEWFNTDWEKRARQNWDTLRHINWLFFREEDDFDDAFQTLIDTINTDLNHVKFHTRLTMRAREWEMLGTVSDLVLRGDDLTAAEGWLAISEGKDPPPTALQRKFVKSSQEAREAGEKAESERQARELALEKRAVRRLRYLLVTVVVFSTIAIGLSLYVITQTQKLSRERNEQLESALRSIIAWSLNGLDGDDFEKLAQMALNERSEDGTGAPPDSEMYQDPLYIAHQEWISQILEIEPNTIPYTFVPTGNGQEILWIGDGFRMIEERMPDQTSFGESYDSSGSELYGGLSGVTVRLDGYSDAFGRWVSAYGPIFNSEGEVVGGIGIDLQLD